MSSMARPVCIRFLCDGGNERERSVVFDDVPVEMSWRLRHGVSIDDWDPNTGFRLRTSGLPEDVPWSMSTVLLVSERVRGVMEQHAPGDAQFLPVTLWRRRNRPVEGQKYWVLNLLHVVDCFDRQASSYDIDTKDGETKFWFDFDGLVIDPDAVPREVQMLRVMHRPVTMLMRVELRERLDAAGVTGMQYLPVRES